MFWIGLLASAVVGCCFGVWSVVLADGLRCRSEGYPSAQEAAVCPVYDQKQAWWSFPWAQLLRPGSDRLARWVIALAGGASWMYTWSLYWLQDSRPTLWVLNTLFCSWLVFLAVLDYRWRILPIELMVGAGLVGVLLRVFLLGDPLMPLVIGAGSMGVFFGLQTWISKGRWLGSGDPVMAAMIGGYIGWPLAATSVYITYMAVIPLLVLQAVRFQAIRRVRWPFGPLLAIGGVFSLTLGAPLAHFFAEALSAGPLLR